MSILRSGLYELGADPETGRTIDEKQQKDLQGFCP